MLAHIISPLLSKLISKMRERRRGRTVFNMIILLFCVPINKTGFNDNLSFVPVYP